MAPDELSRLQALATTINTLHLESYYATPNAAQLFRAVADNLQQKYNNIIQRNENTFNLLREQVKKEQK